MTASKKPWDENQHHTQLHLIGHLNDCTEPMQLQNSPLVALLWVSVLCAECWQGEDSARGDCTSGCNTLSLDGTTSMTSESIMLNGRLLRPAKVVVAE